MTHFLDTLPFDFSRQPAQEMLAFLADMYHLNSPTRRLVQTAGIKPATINWEQPMRGVWADILEQSRNQDKLRDLLRVIKQSDVSVAAKIDEWLGANPPVNATAAGRAEPPWRGFDDAHGLERQLFAEPTLLDVAFLRRGAELAAAVCRLRVAMASGVYLASAFRIADNLLLTNHHALFDYAADGAVAKAIEVWFGYERSLTGAQLPYHVAHGRPESIRGGAQHDWAVFELAYPGVPAGTPTIDLGRPGRVEPGDRVYIIQHPNGAPKKIGMVHNEVCHVDDDVIRYWTDTAAGSSGSPVFDERWRPVALHHRWVEHHTGGTTEYRNQGRRIERVAEALAAAGLG